MEIEEMEERCEPLPPSMLSVAVAVNGNKNSKHALKWALEKFIPEGRVCFRLLYVRPKITMVPTPMGNFLPISIVRDDVASAYMKEIEWKTNSMLLPYKKMCNRKQVEAEAVIIEADDVAEAISVEINKYSVSKLVIGSSSRNIFIRKFKGSKMSYRLSQRIPSFCTMYAVSKGKLSSVHASASETDVDTTRGSTSNIASCSSLKQSVSGQSECMNSETTSSFSLPRSSSLSVQRNQALKVINQGVLDVRLNPWDKHNNRSLSFSTDEDFMSSSSNITEMQCANSTISSYRSSQTDMQSWNSDQASTSDIVKSSENEVDVDFELERLRIELRHLQGMHEMAQKESLDAFHQLDELRACREEEAMRLNMIRLREEKAKQMAINERERREVAEQEAEYVRKCAEKEGMQKKDAEYNAARETTEKQRLERALACRDEQYKKYKWEDIESATSSFSDALKIGSGANGTVYKANFHHTIAAVKILHSNEGRGSKQFKQELEILGKIRHPHLLLLLGACPDHGCLVYEHMENGSLEDRLQCKKNSPPLAWHCRYRIAWEIASGLVFLHNSKPDPIIHRDLKPANILLDTNFACKIGDVGLSTLLPSTNFATSTMYKDTAPAGTFFYMDPEYQRSGRLSPKSDTYAFGIIILQLLTGKPPIGLAHIVETAIESRRLVDVLDSEAGQWPVEETKELALLGLSCAELRRKDRPDLEDRVLPILEKLKDFATKVHDLVPPGHFMCPILEEVMDDPCVASDGYTYERSAIERWFGVNEKLPLTNMKLPDKNLIPNQSLLYAIKEWKVRSRRQR